MFREMRRKNQQLSQETCIEILKTAPRGVLAVHGEGGYPYALPMNHFYHGGKLYFHTAKVGHKLDAIAQRDKICYTVLDEGTKKEGDWAFWFQSVILFGTIRKIDSTTEVVEILRALGNKHYPNPADVEEEISSSLQNVQMLELTIDHMTGKLVHEK